MQREPAHGDEHRSRRGEVMSERASGATKRRLAVVVMGVSGSGKSTVASGIGAALGLHFIDGDSLHSSASVAKMQAGTPLQDADRWPWLDRIGAALADAAQWPQGVVIACSALRRSYRDRIRAAAPGVRFVFLDGPRDLIGSRMAGRSGHYMPGTLLDSQFRTLEVPGEDETDVRRMPIDHPASEIVRRTVHELAQD
jgi:gluconokinase